MNTPENRKRISQSKIDEQPHLVWNGFVDLLAMSEASELTPAQLPAYYVFWYDAEVQNGGHLQYFLNRGTAALSETIKVLGEFGATAHAEILSDATALWRTENRSAPANKDEYVSIALEGEFDDLDQKFYSTQPELMDVLQQYLEQNEGAFIIRE